MTNFKIFLRDGKLMVGEFPELKLLSLEDPIGREDALIENSKRKREHNDAVESAMASAVEVVKGEDVFHKINDWFIPLPGGGLGRKLNEGQLCDLPTGWMVEYKEQYWTGSALSKGSRLPDWIDIPNVDDPIYRSGETRKIARLKYDLRETNPIKEALKESKSPVIPEGSEKKKFEVLLYGEWVELSENQYLQAINNNHYGRINGIEQHRNSAGKPAIDDTLKPRIDRIGELYESGKDDIHGISRFLLPRDDRERLDHLINVIRELRDIAAVEAKAAQDSPQTESQGEVFNEIFNRYHTLICGGYSREDIAKSLMGSFSITRKTV
jgi:hypothetical protein